MATLSALSASDLNWEALPCPRLYFFFWSHFNHQCHQLCWASSFPTSRTAVGYSYCIPGMLCPFYQVCSFPHLNLAKNTSPPHSDNTATPQQSFFGWEQKRLVSETQYQGSYREDSAGWYKLPELLGLKCKHQRLWWNTLSPKGRSVYRNQWLNAAISAAL